MNDAAVLTKLVKAATSYSRDVADLLRAESTNEATFYPAIRSLLSAALEADDLPFEVRINTSEQKTGGGVKLPDVALYDSGGKFLVVCGEVKLPEQEIDELGFSTVGKNQIGRYLATTRAVLCNIRAFGLLGLEGKRPYLADHPNRACASLFGWPFRDSRRFRCDFKVATTRKNTQWQVQQGFCYIAPIPTNYRAF